jgi:hypothetical protein
MIYENAVTYCDNLVLGGSSDWRLPNCHELFSIINHDRNNPAIDTIYFSKTLAEYWWSANPQLDDPAKIWVTNAGGGIGPHLKSETISAGGTKRFHVRAVRDPVPKLPVSSHFRDNNNGTITDMISGLTWQKVLKTESVLWEAALNYSENLNLAGYSDWRLPNIKELQSLNDELLKTPSLDTNYFRNIPVSNLWSSTTLFSQTTKAWYINLTYGLTTYENKTSSFNVICVRDTSMLISVSNGSQSLPQTFFVYQNYPNPFNPTTIIKYDLPQNCFVKLLIFDSIGRETKILINSFKSAGTYETMWNSSGFPGGFYFYRLTAGRYSVTKKMILLK